MPVEAMEALRKLSLFSGLGEESLAAVASRSVIRDAVRGMVLFRHGEPCRGLYVVLKGRVMIYRSNAEGREQVLHTQGPGQTVAEVPLFDGGPCPASARVTESGRLLFLPAEEFERLYRDHPEIANATIRDLGRRLRRMVKLVEKISLRDVPARVAVTLLEYAEPVGGTKGKAFELQRTHEQLAAELATTRESVSRAFSKLRREGLIAQRGTSIRILDARQLQAFASASHE